MFGRITPSHRNWNFAQPFDRIVWLNGDRSPAKNDTEISDGVCNGSCWPRHLSIYLSIYLSLSPSLSLSISISISLSLALSLHLSLYLHLHLHLHLSLSSVRCVTSPSQRKGNVESFHYNAYCTIKGWTWRGKGLNKSCSRGVYNMQFLERLWALSGW